MQRGIDDVNVIHAIRKKYFKGSHHNVPKYDMSLVYIVVLVALTVSIIHVDFKNLVVKKGTA